MIRTGGRQVMMHVFPFSIQSPVLLVIAIVVASLAAVAIYIRRPMLKPTTLWLGAIGAAMLCLAAGGPVWQRPSPGEVAVMVDLSPSTRTADFRSRAQLNRRVHSLLGQTPYRLDYFASATSPGDPGGDILPDLPAEQTVFTPPAAAAGIVLFSDGRFELPKAAPPTYVVIDPLLESPADAAVASLQTRGQQVIVETTNFGNLRQMTVDGMTSTPPTAIASGSYTTAGPLDPLVATISARLNAGDAWPENDQLKAILPPPEHRQQWWVGAAAPDNSWRTFSPLELPTEPAAYLATSVVVLQNIAAPDLTALQQQRLGQYVNDLGGRVIILGGDHAFAAGAYPGSELERLSPLTSTPPRPTTHWILLVDGSGSMNEIQGGFSLWHQASDAVTRLLPQLPPDDLVSTGSFAESLTWWTSGKSAKETMGIPLPPASVVPHGPTNLEDSLLAIGKSADDDLSKQLLLLTDADAEIKDPVALESLLHRKKIRLHLLAIAEGSALPILRNIVRSTGGTLVKQFDPRKWADEVTTLMRSVAPKLLGQAQLPVRYTGEFAALPPTQAMPWNRTWLKESATLLGQGTESDKLITAAAAWNVGQGRVMALAFNPGATTASRIAAMVRDSPRDPRMGVTWKAAERLRVMINAVDGQQYLNHLKVRLDLSANAETASAVSTHEVPQIAPGRYELELSAPREPVFATVFVDGRLVDRIAVAGRYAPEFDAIGNDHDTMDKLARQTGGRVIPPRQIWPIDFRWPMKLMPIRSILAIIGAGLLGAGLVWWKMAG